MPVGFVDHRSAEDQYVEEDDERVEDGERGDLSSHQQLTINICSIVHVLSAVRIGKMLREKSQESGDDLGLFLKR